MAKICGLYDFANPTNYVDCRYALENEDFLSRKFPGHLPFRFDWENKWLRGEQYAHMLQNIDSYCGVFGMKKFG